MLQQGSRGSAVAALQKKLGIAADGIFGPNTAAAVRHYQQTHGLSVDGIAGPQTLGKLGLSGGSGGGGSSKSKSSSTTSATLQQYAEDYGYQLAFLKSDKELYGIFQQAVSGKWDATRFVAKVKASKWYKTHGADYRQNLALKTTDPATWNQKIASQRALIGDMASGMGAAVTNATMAKLTENSVLFGWNDNQIRDQLAGYIKSNATTGQAATDAQKIRSTAYRNGVNLSDQYIQNWQRQIASGAATVENAQQQIRDTYAKTLAPSYAKELASGMDLYDIASPYMQSMANTLELNPADIDLFDPTIRKAMSQTTGADGKPTTPSLWQFEQGLRQDPRFMKTKQAQDQTMAVGHQVLKDMGLTGV